MCRERIESKAQRERSTRVEGVWEGKETHKDQYRGVSECPLVLCFKIYIDLQYVIFYLTYSYLYVHWKKTKVLYQHVIIVYSKPWSLRIFAFSCFGCHLKFLQRTYKFCNFKMSYCLEMWKQTRNENRKRNYFENLTWEVKGGLRGRGRAKLRRWVLSVVKTVYGL